MTKPGEPFDILAQRGPSDEVWAVRDPVDGLWIGTADHVSLYRDLISDTGSLHSAQTRAKCSAVIIQVELERPMDHAIYDGGEWKDTVLTEDGSRGIRFT